MKNARTIALMPFDETPLENSTNATQHSWLASLVAFIAWLFDAITKLKRVKRTTKFKPNWRDHFDGLRHSEWHMAQMLTQGAALLLSGKTLDDADYIDVPMPENYGGPCPGTPFAMNLRFLKLARFMRDPERYIRRHAARIAKRERISATRLRLSSSTRSVGEVARALVARDGGCSRRLAFNAQPRAPPAHHSLFPTPHSLGAQRA